MTGRQTTSEPRQGRSAILNVGAGIAVASVAGYVLLALVGRMLTKSEFGLFLSYWGVMFGLASSLAMIEQEAARQSAEGDTTGTVPIRRVAAAAAVIASLAAATTLLPPVAGLVYGDADSPLGALAVIAVIGFSMQFMIRGLLMGHGMVQSYSLLVVAEATARLVALAVVWLTVGASLGSVAGAVAVGAFAWLLWVRPARLLTAGTPKSDPGLRSWRGPLRRAASLMLAAALTAAIITGYPTMVTAFAGGTIGDEGGTVFATLQASRVPLLFVAPLQALAVPTIIRWRDSATAEGPNAHLLLVRALLATVAVAAVGAVAAWFVGPWGVQVAFGAKYVVAPAVVAGLVFSACFLALLQLMSAALVAFGSYRWTGIVWGGAVLATITWLVVSPFSVTWSTVVGAIVGPLVGVTIAVVVLWRITARQPTFSETAG